MQLSHVVRPVRFASAQGGADPDEGAEHDPARSASASIAGEPAAAFHLPGFHAMSTRMPATALEAAVLDVLSKHSQAVEQPHAVTRITHGLESFAPVAPEERMIGRRSDPATEDCPYCPAARLKHARFCQRCGRLQDSTGGTVRDPG